MRVFTGPGDEWRGRMHSYGAIKNRLVAGLDRDRGESGRLVSSVAIHRKLPRQPWQLTFEIGAKLGPREIQLVRFA